ncbi:hypothetical protein V500_09457 [Pseudogymnoascus sp. VKM F-4518 (FW-2643)]|nr:hypothetical protein V500_09457 [Pseudogymnoascus sp. VKM F-4518 (FW-2643)]
MHTSTAIENGTTPASPLHGIQYGKRLFPQVLDDAAAINPDNVIGMIAKSADISAGFREVTFLQLSNAVNFTAWWIQAQIGRSETFETLAYMGIQDFRYLIVEIAAVKCGYQILLPGGNNQMVWHGAVFSGQFPNTTWPGFTSFGYLFSEPWSKHQPVWNNGFAEVNDFVGRTQWVLQSGIPQRDVAFWYKSQLNIVRDDSISNNFTDLIAAGYGYEFISPANFDLTLAKVKNKILAPDGPSYKVLVLRSDDSLTLAGTQKLVQYAKQGLPIL